MRRNIYRILVLLFSLLTIISTKNVFSYYSESSDQKERYENLVQLTQERVCEQRDEDIIAETYTAPDGLSILPEYERLYQINNDIVGWIQIEGTEINYPVMQSIHSPNYYLKHGFDKAYTDYGCPYIDEACDMVRPSDNLFLYGHNMRDGSMFADLEKYKRKDFWTNHATILFDTLYAKQTYVVVAAFKTTVNTGSPSDFAYYQFIDADSSEQFDEFISYIKKHAFYETGVTAEYGDQLITLSTCEYSNTNGRMVVVAKRVRD